MICLDVLRALGRSRSRSTLPRRGRPGRGRARGSTRLAERGELADGETTRRARAGSSSGWRSPSRARSSCGTRPAGRRRVSRLPVGGWRNGVRDPAERADWALDHRSSSADTRDGLTEARGTSEQLERERGMLTPVPRSDCTAAREAASARLDGELSELEAARLDLHLRGCAECRVYAEGIQAIAAELRAAPLEPPQITSFCRGEAAFRLRDRGRLPRPARRGRRLLVRARQGGQRESARAGRDGSRSEAVNQRRSAPKNAAWRCCRASRRGRSRSPAA